MVKSILIVGLGGFIGTASRYLISRHFQLHYDSSFPWDTFLINIAGSLLIGLFFGIAEKGNLLSHEWRIFLTVGLCGGFTTFSSLSHEAFILLQNNEFWRFAIYSGLSFVLGLFAVFLGRYIIEIL